MVLAVGGRAAELSHTLAAAVEVVSDERQSDSNGFGLIARKPLAKGAKLIDHTALFIQRPAVYALAHQDQFDYLACGLNGYFQLREPVLQYCALTFFMNEARHQGREGPPANVCWRTVWPAGGERQLEWQLLKSVAAGEELIADYSWVLRP
jgi:hypothetical protein